MRNGSSNHTTPYTPQPNGKAERINRPIIENGRCLMIDGGMSEEFWAENEDATAEAPIVAQQLLTDWQQRKIVA